MDTIVLAGRFVTYPLFYFFFQILMLRREFAKLIEDVQKSEEGNHLNTFNAMSIIHNVWEKNAIEKGKNAKPDIVIMGDMVTNTWKHVRILILLILQAATTTPDILKLTEGGFFVIMPICATTLTAMGVAWYIISFGSVPARHLSTALSVTFFMCWAFCAALLLFTELTVIVVWQFAPAIAVWIALISIGVYVSGVLYDSMDLLKAGIDEESLKFYRSGTPGMKQIADAVRLLGEISSKLDKAA